MVGYVLASVLFTAAGLTPAKEAPANQQDKKSQVPIIDTHTHFYDPTRPQGVPWPGKTDKRLYRPVLPDEYKRCVSSAPHRARSASRVGRDPSSYRGAYLGFQFALWPDDR